MQVLVINPYPLYLMTSVAQTPTPTTREEMVSYFNSDDFTQKVRDASAKLLELQNQMTKV